MSRRARALTDAVRWRWHAMHGQMAKLAHRGPLHTTPAA